MTIEIVFKTLGIWLGILMLAMANGALREIVLIPALGKPSGLILSGILLSSLILAFTYFTLPWFGLLTFTNYVVIGIAWLCLTLVFEFTFGYIFQGKTWSQLLEAYIFRDGNIWPIVLLVTAVAPCLAARIRGWM